MGLISQWHLHIPVNIQEVYQLFSMCQGTIHTGN
jgi:hypothetical protein